MGNKNLSYEERTKIKRSALDKLDKIIEGELKYLHDLNPEEPNFKDFKFNIREEDFTSEELYEIRPNIEKLKSDDIIEVMMYLGSSIQFRGLIWPWGDVRHK